MVVSLENMNAVHTEAVVNTYDNEKFEVPGSMGAKSVVLKSGLIAGYPTNLEADGIHKTKGTIMAGDKTSRTSMAHLGNNGVMGAFDDMQNGDGTDFLAVAINSPVLCVAPWAIPKSEDGKYYVTLEIQGSGTSATPRRNLFSGSFLIEK